MTYARLQLILGISTALLGLVALLAWSTTKSGPSSNAAGQAQLQSQTDVPRETTSTVPPPRELVRAQLDLPVQAGSPPQSKQESPNSVGSPRPAPSNDGPPTRRSANIVHQATGDPSIVADETTGTEATTGAEQTTDTQEPSGKSSQKTDSIINPFYASREWSVWSIDDFAKADVPPELSLTEEASRIFPTDQGLFSVDKAPSPYAGFSDDVYASQDNFHSRLGVRWTDTTGNVVDFSKQIPILRRDVYKFGILNNELVSPATAEFRLLGVSMTSQSTTGMGHQIVNNSVQMLVHEREFHFSNILRAGPAHVSFRDLSQEKSIDEYKALSPSMLNSVGSSGSETWALTKLAIAGANLRKDVKQTAKLHGIYPSTLLYLWKAALPYDVPFDHELRHRVAYFADGNDRGGRGNLQASAVPLAHQYDDTKHLESMIRLARGLQAVPPVSVVTIKQVTGGKHLYGVATTSLIEQEVDDTRVRFSTSPCFDVQGRPLSVRVTQLYGSPDVQIERIHDDEWQLTVPFRPDLPKGRTSVAVIANNGETDGNPHIINVYRTLGNDNLRPTITMSGDLKVMPGETTEIVLKANDPEGFPVQLSRTQGGPGTLTGDKLNWKCPRSQPQGTYPVTVIASDHTCGNSYAALSVPIEVRRTIALLKPSVPSGKVPLTVAFSSRGSRDITGEELDYHWTFGDGSEASNASPKNSYRTPGFHRVSLSVKGRSGTATANTIIHAQQTWPQLLGGDWASGPASADIWNTTGDIVARTSPRGMATIVSKRSKERKSIDASTKVTIPCYVDVIFQRSNNVEGAGIEIFGAKFGKFTRDLSFLPSGEATDSDASQFIARHPAIPWLPSRLQVYVTDDPLHAERFVFSGVLTTDDGESHFRFANQSLAGDTISILGGEMGTQVITSLRVWAK